MSDSVARRAFVGRCPRWSCAGDVAEDYLVLAARLTPLFSRETLVIRAVAGFADKP